MENVKFECFAGRMLQEGNRVKPEPSKGKIRVVEDEDQLNHFQWINVASGSVEMDTIVLAGESKFMKAVQSKGRVYILDNGEDNFFFWFQEPDQANDSNLCAKINEVIGSEDFTGYPPQQPQEPQQSQQSSIPQQPQQSSMSQQNAEQLAKILQAFAQAPQQASPSLDEILTNEELRKIAEDPEYQELLIPLLPEGQSTPGDLRTNLLSPQLRQALRVLSGALQSEAGYSVLMSLGLQSYIPQDSNYYDCIETLIKAIQAKAKDK